MHRQKNTGWLRHSATAIVAAVLTAAAPARADATVEGYPYFAKLLGGRDADDHREFQIRDMAVTAEGDLIIVAHARSESLTVTNDIRFAAAVHPDRDAGIVLCMAPSGEWKWGIALEGANSDVRLQAVAVDDTHAYVAGSFHTEVRYSRLKPSLGPDDEPDAEEEREPVLDSYSANPLASKAGYHRGLVVKIGLADGLRAGALEVATGKGDATLMHSRLHDIALHQDSIFVCGDIDQSNQDWLNICGHTSGYNVQDGFLAAKCGKALTSCAWIVYADDAGSGAGGAGHRQRHCGRRRRQRLCLRRDRRRRQRRHTGLRALWNGRRPGFQRDPHGVGP